MRVVVTGGAGFIGANLCRQLCANDAVSEVVVLDDLSTGRKQNLEGLCVDLVEGSVLDSGALVGTCDGASAIVHLAARSSVPRSIAEPVPAHEVNVTGTINVLEAARAADNAHVVFASSSSVYGANPALPKREDLAPRPVSPYAASKLAAESYALAWQASYGLPVLPLRFFNVFGPLQTRNHAYAAVVPAFLTAAMAGQPLPVHGDGTQSRDFTYVDTVCSVIADAVVRRVASEEPLNLAYGTRTSVLELVALFEALLDRSLPVRFEDARPGDVAHTQACTERLVELFPDVEPVGLHRGLRTTIGWAMERPDEFPQLRGENRNTVRASSLDRRFESSARVP